MTVTGNRKTSVEANSLGGFHGLGGKDHYDFLQTQQPFPSHTPRVDDKMALTGMWGQGNNQTLDHANRTQNSFLTQTTSPHLYLEVQRPSMMKILNQKHKQSSQSPLQQYRQQPTFHKKHHSLNENARKLEALRIKHENNKILLRMDNSRPTIDLQTDKLKKKFNKCESLKK